MTQEKKHFVGNGKYIANGKALKFGLCLDRIPAEFITKSKNGERWVNLVAWLNSEPDKYGNHTSLQVDTYKPTEREPQQVGGGELNGLPF